MATPLVVSPGSLAVKISLVLVTQNRPDLARQALDSLTRCSSQVDQVVVVDQSQPGQLLQAPSDIDYLAICEQGLSRGRNRGIALARGDIIVCIDDDCTVQPGWLDDLKSRFSDCPQLGLVFGQVIPVAHDPAQVVIPGLVFHQSALARNFSERIRVEGMGACMALRRRCWERVSGFDCELGAGTSLRAGEELDFSLRVMASGYWVSNEPGFQVFHHGSRSLEELAALAGGYWQGTGAAIFKNLRAGRLEVGIYLAHLALRFLIGRSPHNHGLPVSRLLRFQAFLRGAAKGFCYRSLEVKS